MKTVKSIKWQRRHELWREVPQRQSACQIESSEEKVWSAASGWRASQTYVKRVSEWPMGGARVAQGHK